MKKHRTREAGNQMNEDELKFIAICTGKPRRVRSSPRGTDTASSGAESTACYRRAFCAAGWRYEGGVAPLMAPESLRRRGRRGAAQTVHLI
ncbi:hypothetical protein EYF80_011710 [Liparis tanakae]|uniref:Uncharacterized protein n=1 Tax=Liparis tanakae TaxID=230148 RepID=A0A4Z2IJF3_9TELE|nr:hypothetical protein EYF80_011710 [Liparis tanakae]